MATQNAKFIDVTKSFLPIDPQAFPESMHGTAREDAPEQRIPAAAYQGYNFLPTSYGYKSYFGTNQHLDIDALGTRVDYIFTFQNEVFENFLIALTESGIWIKAGSVSGAWVQIVADLVPVDPDTHFDWSYCIISDVLYCYKQGAAQFHKITSQATAPGYLVTSVTPTFLNMAGQSGIFRAGGRLGFWDSADSVAWSNLDDTGDFTPSLETLAGNSIFSDVNGRIVMIRPHGEGFMIYASKSIVYIAQDTAGTFQWNPLVVLSNSGIAYRDECTVAQPDTVHFAYTNTGLFKIDKAKGEIIVPEVTDYLKEAKGPIYPKVLEGRYLFLQVLDPDYLNGLVQFSDEIVPEVDYVFPANNQTLDEAIEDITVRGIGLCSTFNGINNGGFDEQQPGGSGGVPAILDKKPGTSAKPIWKCWISNNSVLDPGDLTFGNVPCSVTDPNGVTTGMSPVGDSGRLDAMTQDSTKKQGLLGSDVYVDGIWTIERFIAVQTAIWDKQKENQKALVAKILNRAAIGEKVTNNLPTCTAVPRGKTDCYLGRYVTDYSEPVFGLSSCQFWLTRYALSAIDIQARKSFQTVCLLTPEEQYTAPISGWRYNGPTTSGYAYPSADAACAAAYLIGNVPPGSWGGDTVPSPQYSVACKAIAPAGGTPTYGSDAQGVCPGGYSLVLNTSGGVVNYRWDCFKAAYYTKTEYMYAYNVGEYADISPTPETAFCEIVGWEYTANDNTTKTVAAASCTAPKKLPKDGDLTPLNNKLQDNPEDQSGNPFNQAGGTVCSKPFEPVTLPGIPPSFIDWEDQVVTIPAGNFLLQKGSIAPVYPDMYGALVYDMYLKKWGKYRGQYKTLLDYQPLNDQSGGGIPYNRFGILGGVLKSNGFVYVFDPFPSFSSITYGKIGYYRMGKTSVEECHVHFRTLSKGSMVVDTSLDGRGVSAGLSKTVEYDSVLSADIFGGFPGSWQNITINGIFDIQYLEYRGFIQGKR